MSTTVIIVRRHTTRFLGRNKHTVSFILINYTDGKFARVKRIIRKHTPKMYFSSKSYNVNRDNNIIAFAGLKFLHGIHSVSVGTCGI